MRAYIDELARCVPHDPFDALKDPVEPKPTFTVDAAALAREAQLVDEEFFLSV